MARATSPVLMVSRPGPVVEVDWDSFGQAGSDPQQLAFAARASQAAGVECGERADPVNERGVGVAGRLWAGGWVHGIDEAVDEVSAVQP